MNHLIRIILSKIFPPRFPKIKERTPAEIVPSSEVVQAVKDRED